MADTIRVVPGPKLDPNRVALWEVHDDHPGGEVFVAGPEPVEVAQTSLVNEKLSRGILARASEAPRQAQPAAAPESREEPTGPATAAPTRESRGRG